ncbi:hypothetical protein LCGC14_3020490 [marine sediment metagenome]|uniref:DUF5675 domain-containing protein n=1 Tax=marine sediment metagenome TaxID=412755 RepID=A0A0F8XIB7_9ZZZZ
MDYRLLRINSQLDYSMGVLFTVENLPERIRHLCYTLEDEFREVKVRKETRIPADTYELKLRTEGPLNARYQTRFNDIHQGMIWLQNVPNFKWIYLHCGNDDDDTDGCVLVGSYLRLNRVLNSRSTYRAIYPGIVENIKEGPTYIEIIDYDTAPKVIT